MPTPTVHVHVIQDQAEVRHALLDAINDIPQVQADGHSEPWELAERLKERHVTPGQILVTDLYSPGYWQKHPQRDTLPNPASPGRDSESEEAVTETAVDRITRYLYPLVAEYGLLPVVYTHMFDYWDAPGPSATRLARALESIGADPGTIVRRSPESGSFRREIDRLTALIRVNAERIVAGEQSVAAAVNAPNPGQRLESDVVEQPFPRLTEDHIARQRTTSVVYVVEENPTTARDIVKALTREDENLTREYDLRVRRYRYIWDLLEYFRATGRVEGHVVVCDLYALGYWRIAPHLRDQRKRRRRVNPDKPENIHEAVVNVIRTYLRTASTTYRMHVIVYTHVLRLFGTRYPDWEAEIRRELNSAGIADEDIVPKQVKETVLEVELAQLRSKVASALKET